jgi:hypothetical protein
MVVGCSSEITYYYRVVDSIWLTVDIEKSSLDVDLIRNMLNYALFSSWLQRFPCLAEVCPRHQLQN